MKLDNQQERPTFEIGYLLGVIDSDGCYQFAQDRKKYLYPQVVINNNNQGLIRRFAQYLDNLDIRYWIWSPKPYGKEKRIGQRLYVKGLKRFAKFYDSVAIYDHAKKPRADILKEYLDYRLSIPIKNGIKPYLGKEQEFKRKLNSLNQENKGKVSPETIR